MQNWWDTRRVGCRTGEMQDSRNADRTYAGKEGFMRGMQDRSRVVEPEPPFLAGASARKKVFQL